jgi:ABC-type transport system substrate-binding protein
MPNPEEETLASISIKRHGIILASLGLLLVAAVACGGGESGGGASGKAGIDPDAFRSFEAGPAALTDDKSAAEVAADAAAAAAAAAAPAATAVSGTAAATAAPAAAADATAAPAMGGSDVVPSGEATIAVNAVNAGVGTPRFCTAGCAEDVYVAGIMETLFRPVYQDTLGEQAEEAILALSFDLDPDLVFLDFELRPGVQFHDGWGEFTAADVVFSFNDANRNTQPESIHGQAGDFAPLIKNFEVIDDYNVRMYYENYDSRGIRHRFSTFWQSAGITSVALFDDKGAEGMRDFIVGTGPYKNISWIQADSIKLEAVPNHYRQTANVAKITLLEVPEASSRRAMLETGQVIMAQPALADWNTLAAAGFDINLDSGHGTIRNIGMTGNWWEDNRYYDDKVLERETSDKAWVSDTNSGDDYEAARLVRIGLAHGIDRQALVDSILDGWGDGPMYFGYQPPNAHPITQSHASDYVDASKGGNGGADGWEYPLDYDLAKEFITAGGFPDGFAMSNVWTGPPGLPAELMTAIGGIWAVELGVDVTLNNSVYSTYRPGLVARTTSEPFVGCGDDSNTSMPYDWARGFVMSSWSDGGYGVGMEIPFAAENYAKVALMTDKAERNAANEAFSVLGINNALCIGLVHEPVGTLQNPDLVAAYEKLPQANGNLQQFVNLESLKLK